MRQRPTVGIHDFFNSRPLLHPIRHGLIETPFTLVIDNPANLARRFHDGELDIALIPSIEYARSDDAVIIPDLCIASIGKVETVILFSDLAMEDIETVLVDPKSRTSVAMLTILFKELYDKEPVIIVSKDDDPASMLRGADAGLVIGDAAFGVDREKYVVNDLGELWYRSKGRPFVHALLCAKEGYKWEAAIAALVEAKKTGLAHRDLVAKEEKKGVLGYEELYDYLTTRILYNLDEEEIAGLSHFLKEAKKLELCKRDDLKFYRHSPSKE